MKLFIIKLLLSISSCFLSTTQGLSFSTQEYRLDEVWETQEEIKISYISDGVQERINARDSRRSLSKDPFWKTWFPEILAGVLISSFAVGIFCWCYCTKHTIHGTITAEQRQEMVGVGGSRSTRMSITDIGSVPLKPMNLNCPKPACVCGPKPTTKGKRKWNYKEDNESYGPSA